MARRILSANDAPNEGVRRLCQLLRYQTAPQLARRIGTTGRTVNRWANAEVTPSVESRAEMAKPPPYGFGIPLEAWEIGPGDDTAATRRR